MTTATSLPSPMTSSASSRGSSPVPALAGRARTNRAALRDYYKLQPGSSTPAGDSGTKSPAMSSPLAREFVTERLSEIDQAEFDAEAYVKERMTTDRLAILLQTEANLISEIKSLDGDKKALVYDNYSKLIRATDTIKSMRENMGPLTPTTGSLGSSLEKISQLTRNLAQPQGATALSTSATPIEEERQQQQALLRWIQQTPNRLSHLISRGQKEDAKSIWEEVDAILCEWQNVDGVQALRDECMAIINDT